MNTPTFMATDPFAAMATKAREAAHLLKQMSNEYRLLLLCTLSQGELSVGELNRTVPLSQSALSQHLGSLRRAGLVATRKEAQTVYYRLQGSAAIQVIETLQAIYCPELEQNPPMTDKEAAS